MSVSVPFFDLRRRHVPIQNALLDRVRHVVHGASYFDGPEVAALEGELVDRFDLKACVAVGSGVSAIQTALDILDVEPGDEIIAPALISGACAEALLGRGAHLKLVDVDPNSFQMLPDAAATTIRPRTRALFVPNPFGSPAPCAALDRLCRKTSIQWIDDASEALGASSPEGPVGARGSIGVCSFQPWRNLGALGDGGAVVCRDEAVASQMERPNKQWRRDSIGLQEMGYSTAMQELQAATIRVQLPSLDAWNQARRRLDDRYRRAFEKLPLTFQSHDSRHSPAPNATAVLTESRDALRNQLRATGIGARVGFESATHLMPPLARLGYRKGDFPNAEAIAERCLCLPNYPELSEEQFTRVVEGVRNFFG